MSSPEFPERGPSGAHSSEQDDRLLKNMLAAISTERCSAQRCDRAAVAVAQRAADDLFYVCANHSERAVRWGLPVFQPGENSSEITTFVPDHDVTHARWEQNWATADYSPEWGISSIPPEIRQAADDGWFPAGASLLDIGCGSGEIAAWLARRGYDVLGVDFSHGAVAKAKAAYEDVPGLAFEVVDIRHGTPGTRRFDALLDRGCLRVVGQEHAAAYVRHAAAAAKPGARFLLLLRRIRRRTETSGGGISKSSCTGVRHRSHGRHGLRASLQRVVGKAVG